VNLFVVFAGKSGDCDSSNARMAISPSVDSDICRLARTERTALPLARDKIQKQAARADWQG